MTHSATCLGAILSGHHSSKQISKCLAAWQIIISLNIMGSEEPAPTWGLKTLCLSSERHHFITSCSSGSLRWPAVYSLLVDTSCFIILKRTVCVVWPKESAEVKWIPLNHFFRGRSKQPKFTAEIRWKASRAGFTWSIGFPVGAGGFYAKRATVLHPAINNSKAWARQIIRVWGADTVTGTENPDALFTLHRCLHKTQ